MVLMCRPTRPSERVVVDRADVGDQSPQGNGWGLRRSGGEALVPVVQAAYLGSRPPMVGGCREIICMPRPGPRLESGRHDHEEVAGPGLVQVVADERGPALAALSVEIKRAVLRDGARETW